MPQNSPKKTNSTSEERIREIARDFDFGDGSEVIITSYKSKADKEERITYLFSSQLPKLSLDSKIAKKELEIECSSADEDNQSLLHYLFKKNH
jgi:hypothetical protein